MAATKIAILVEQKILDSDGEQLSLSCFRRSFCFLHDQGEIALNPGRINLITIKKVLYA